MSLIVEIKVVGVDGIIICSGSSGGSGSRTSVAVVVVVVIDVYMVVSTLIVVVEVMSKILYAINLSQIIFH